MASSSPRRNRDRTYALPSRGLNTATATTPPPPLDWSPARQWTLVVELTSAALSAGWSPVAALKRAVQAVNTLHTYVLGRNGKSRPVLADDYPYLQHLLIGALSSHGPEGGNVLAGRAIEAWRLLTKWRAGEWRVSDVDERVGEARRPRKRAFVAPDDADDPEVDEATIERAGEVGLPDGAEFLAGEVPSELAGVVGVAGGVTGEGLSDDYE